MHSAAVMCVHLVMHVIVSTFFHVFHVLGRTFLHVMCMSACYECMLCILSYECMLWVSLPTLSSQRSPRRSAQGKGLVSWSWAGTPVDNHVKAGSMALNPSIFSEMLALALRCRWLWLCSWGCLPLQSWLWLWVWLWDSPALRLALRWAAPWSYSVWQQWCWSRVKPYNTLWCWLPDQG